MNFVESSTPRGPSEFLAVVLAGFGNELQPLTANYGDQPCPKALLPVANRPMLAYTLSWIEEAGITDVLLICPASHRDPISHHIHSDPSAATSSALAIDIQTFDAAQDSPAPAGTAHILAHFATRIAADFVLFPCDFFPPPDLRLDSVLDKFRVESSTDGAIATALFYETRSGSGHGEGGEKGKSTGGGSDDVWSHPPPPPAIAYEVSTGTLLHVDTLDDQDRDGDELALRIAVLAQHPRLTLSTRLADAHVYVCRRAVLDVLQLKQADADSFREEFFPWLCKLSTHRARRRKYAGLLLAPSATQMHKQGLALQHSTSHPPASSQLRNGERRRSDRADASPGSTTNIIIDNDNKTNNSNSEHSSPDAITLDAADPDAGSPPLSLRVGLVVHPLACGYAARANTVATYFELNRRALGGVSSAVSSRGGDASSSLVDPKASVAADSLVGASARVGERTMVKRSVVGAHCVIGRGARLAGCVLMEYCEVGDGVRLEGCILGKNTKVGARAELTRCLTQAGYEVEPGGVYKNEKMEVNDWASGAVDDDEDESEGSEASDGDESDE